jgi:DNA-binding MarR family transcriptional regulator
MNDVRQKLPKARPAGEASAGTKRRQTAPPSLAFLLLSFQVQRQAVDTLEAHGRDLDLGATEIIALLWLSLGASPVSGVAKAVGLHPNGTSVLIERMRARRLVKRERSRDDRRLAIVSLTTTGHSLAATLSAKLEQDTGLLLAPLSASERAQLISFLQRLSSPTH